MKIMCQEHYDKVVHYAKELGDESLQACLAKLRSWEEHSHRPCEIELYRDFPPPTRSYSSSVIRTAHWA